MRYFKRPFTVIVLVAMAPLFAADTPKTGYVDIEYVFQNSALKKIVYAEYKAQKEKITTAKTEAEKKLQDIKAALQQKQDLLGFEEFEEEDEKIKKQSADLEKTIIEAREELKKWESENMSSLFDELLIVLEIIAKEENMSIILSKKSNIIYSENSLDVTQRAIDLINETDERSIPAAK